ncbi:hypothetical protein K8R03_02815 [Candidatus Kaiserbacteria bacterium]|nr:hypothetical protein [Candidatus Kaiserbacteria bacterium]
MRFSRPAMLVVAVVAVTVLLVSRTGVFRPSQQVTEVKEHATVVLTDKGFEPNNVTIRVGGTVTFSTTNGRPFWPASDPHPNHTLYPAFDPLAPVAADATWQFRFDKIGRWGYHDHIRSYYTGTIHVVQ